MRASLIRHVDPWQDAESGVRHEGGLGADRLPRLSAVAALQIPLQVSISFHRGRDAGQHGAVEVELEVHGRFAMSCQRCLEPVTVDSEVQARVWVVRDEAAALALQATGEAVVSAPGERLDLATLIEDEVLLAMPFAPSHENETCEVHAGYRTVGTVGGRGKKGEAGGFSPQGDHAEEGFSGVGGPGSSEPPQDNRSGIKRNPFAVLASLRDNTDDKD